MASTWGATSSSFEQRCCYPGREGQRLQLASDRAYAVWKALTLDRERLVQGSRGEESLEPVCGELGAPSER